MAEEESLELQSEKLTWVVRNVLKDEFTMGRRLATILRDMFPSFPPPQFDSKADMARKFLGYYKASVIDKRS